MTDAELGKYFYYGFTALFIASAIFKPSFYASYLWLKISVISVLFILCNALINPSYYGAKSFNELLSASLLIQQLLISLIPAFLWVTLFRFILKR